MSCGVDRDPATDPPVRRPSIRSHARNFEFGRDAIAQSFFYGGFQVLLIALLSDTFAADNLKTSNESCVAPAQ